MFGIKRMPVTMVSSFDNLFSGNAARFRFILRLNAFTYGFQKISGLEVARTLEEIEEGGVNDHKIYVGGFSSTEADLTLYRGMLFRTSDAVNKGLAALAGNLEQDPIAKRAAIISSGALDPQQTLEKGPAFGVIEVFNPKTFSLSDMWTFTSLGMTRRSVPDLDAGSSGMDGEESITLKVINLIQRPVFNSKNVIPGLDAVENAVEGIQELFEKPKEPEKSAESEKPKIDPELEKAKKALEEARQAAEAAKAEAEAARQEAERLKKEAEDAKKAAKKEADKLHKEAEDAKKAAEKAEKELKQKQEAEKKAQEELKQKQEAERKAKEEAERKAKEEVERKAAMKSTTERIKELNEELVQAQVDGDEEKINSLNQKIKNLEDGLEKILALQRELSENNFKKGLLTADIISINKNLRNSKEDIKALESAIEELGNKENKSEEEEKKLNEKKEELNKEKDKQKELENILEEKTKKLKESKEKVESLPAEIESAKESLKEEEAKQDAEKKDEAAVDEFIAQQQ